MREFADVQPDMVLEGVVTNVTKFGAFVDIGVHQDGLVHISELSNKFIKDPSEAVKAGQIVKVKVLSADIKTKRIALSMKALMGPGQGAFEAQGTGSAGTAAAAAVRTGSSSRSEAAEQAAGCRSRRPWRRSWRCFPRSGRCPRSLQDTFRGGPPPGGILDASPLFADRCETFDLAKYSKQMTYG